MAVSEKYIFFLILDIFLYFYCLFNKLEKKAPTYLLTVWQQIIFIRMAQPTGQAEILMFFNDSINFANIFLDAGQVSQSMKWYGAIFDHWHLTMISSPRVNRNGIRYNSVEKARLT